LAAKLGIPQQINNLIIKKIFLQKTHFFRLPLKNFVLLHAQKTENNIKQHLKLIENEEISSYTRTGLPLHGGLRKHPERTRSAYSAR
jgi:hypothetical protein